MSSKLKLTGTGGGDTILQGNDSITTDQTFTLPDNGGEIVTAPAGGSVVGYQQGDWVPVMAAGSGTYDTGSSDHLRWSRIGNQVTIRGYMVNIASGGSGAIRVEGLPYPSNGATASLGAIMTSLFAVNGTASYVTSDILTFFYSTPNTAWAQIQATQRTNSSAAIWFSITYETSDTTWTPINGATIS